MPLDGVIRYPTSYLYWRVCGELTPAARGVANGRTNSNRFHFKISDAETFEHLHFCRSGHWCAGGMDFGYEHFLTASPLCCLSRARNNAQTRRATVRWYVRCALSRAACCSIYGVPTPPTCLLSGTAACWATASLLLPLLKHPLGIAEQRRKGGRADGDVVGAQAHQPHPRARVLLYGGAPTTRLASLNARFSRLRRRTPYYTAYHRAHTPQRRYLGYTTRHDSNGTRRTDVTLAALALDMQRQHHMPNYSHAPRAASHASGAPAFYSRRHLRAAVYRAFYSISRVRAFWQQRPARS